jgi:hypothetical protein
LAGHFLFQEAKGMGLQLPLRHNKPPDTTPARRPPPIPIGYLASGSGGVNLALTFRLYMRIAGRAHRLQPPLLVNYNEAENGRISTLLEPARRIGQLLAILPRHVHTGSEGFGGDPTAWKEDEGLITLDLEQMATRFRAHGHRIGSQPGVFLEFLVAGGGHAELGLIAHQAVTATAGANTFYLPVCLIPDEPTQYAWLREYTWHRYEEALAGLWGLWIDNAALPQAVINDSLAIGLTSLDACSSSALTSGSLHQAVASIRNAIKHRYPAAGDGQQHPRNGFLRLSVIRRKVRSVKVWCFSIPFRQRKVVRTSANDLEYAIRTAIRDCLETPAGLLDTNPLPQPGIPQVVSVSVPVKPEVLSDIVQTVKAILNREEWWQPHKDTTSLLWGAINFPDPVVLDITRSEPSDRWVTRLRRGGSWLLTIVPRLLHLVIFGRNHRQQELSITVTRLFPELGALNRLQHILHPAGFMGNGHGATGCGFGTHQHQITAPPEPNSHAEPDPVRT